VVYADDLERGRESYVRGAWSDAYDSLSRADRAASLGAEDLELLARSAYMLGLDDNYLSGLERAHHAHLDAEATLRAVRCAFWIGHNLLFRAKTVRATGWFARAQRVGCANSVRTLIFGGFTWGSGLPPTAYGRAPELTFVPFRSHLHPWGSRPGTSYVVRMRGTRYVVRMRCLTRARIPEAGWGRKLRLLLRTGRDCTLAVISLGFRCRGGGHAWSGRLSISPFAKCWR
jgi:hypothetical protein